MSVRPGPCFPSLVLSLALIVSVGCSGDRTSLLVVVTSDLEAPSQINTLDLVVTGDAVGGMATRTYALSSGWPHTISLRPGRTESQGVTIEVTALLGGTFVARRLVRSAFVSGEQVIVRIHFPASCASVVCGEGEDCQDGDCVSLLPDAGTMDSGMDSGVMDTSVPDGGCTSAAECDDSVACTLDLCEDGVCRNEVDDARCADGSTCDPVEGCPPRSCATDGECADPVACNGIEVCTDLMCEPGAVIDCNDGDACTSDQCDEATRGTCLHTTRDVDRDGFGDSSCAELGGVPATDCNDTNPDVNPSAPEICNGIDDDCTRGCDDTFTCCRGEIGACPTACGTMGSRVCTGTCSWDVCSPPAEICNGADDDCNGAPDEVFACVQGASESCTTSCGSMGTRTCLADCSWSACSPGAEVCNALDDDCDGSVDETFSCARGSSTTCPTSCGSTGSRTCSGTCSLGGCVPPPEGCNGVDDDCDGLVDETSECTPGTTGSCTTMCGSTGSRTCGATCTYGACSPPAEICNGNDDDCDGIIDETFTCIPGTSGSCSTPCGTTGVRTCNASCTWDACVPPVESCNGMDDDCDASCDETFTCCAGSSGTCNTSCGTTGTRTCSGTCGWSVCSPPMETCNGVDDDCNATCDDGFTCCAGTTQSCVTTCGTSGIRTCTAGCAWGACTATEICNGIDDDCDLLIDETFPCTPSQRGTCPTSCGTTGNQICAADCSWGACQLPVELCNGIDDDCDTMVDESCFSCPVFGNDSFGYVGCADTPAGPPPCADISLTGTPLTLLDDDFAVVPLGFTFDFYGTSYTTGEVQSNGAFTFGSTLDIYYISSCLPEPLESTFIAPFWDDLNPEDGIGNQILYQTMGSAPNRRFVVQWIVDHYLTTPTTAEFRMVLFEGSNDIRVCYVDTDFGTAIYDAGLTATSGIQGDPTSALQFSCNTAALTDGLVLDYAHP